MTHVNMPCDQLDFCTLCQRDAEHASLRYPCVFLVEARPHEMRTLGGKEGQRFAVGGVYVVEANKLRFKLILGRLRLTICKTDHWYLLAQPEGLDIIELSKENGKLLTNIVVTFPIPSTLCG